jgi:hypothetical protein
MKPLRVNTSIAALAIFLGGCAATDKPGTERGPDGTIAYEVLVESNEPGAKIEVNYRFEGVTPLKIKIFGDRDGTFHNFGSDDFIVRAYPSRTNDFPQTKIFRTGTMGVKDDKIPDRISFEFGPAAGKTK